MITVVIMYSLTLCTLSFFFFFNDTATTEIYTLSLHDALPIFGLGAARPDAAYDAEVTNVFPQKLSLAGSWQRSEEHTSELQSRQYLVCRLLLEKKKKTRRIIENLYHKDYLYLNLSIISHSTSQ